ncbi:hypothetical protein Tco_0045944 [Tanacetum coccineum]
MERMVCSSTFPQLCCRNSSLLKKTRKAKNILLQGHSKDYFRRFHGMDDAKEDMGSHQNWFGGNANSKKTAEGLLHSSYFYSNQYSEKKVLVVFADEVFISILPINQRLAEIQEDLEQIDD